MNWTNDFLDQCLSGIPQGAYYNRLRKELEDHLILLSQDMAEAGYGDVESKAEALRQMGDPAILNRSYRQDWMKHPERVRNDISHWFRGSMLAGICYLISVIVLGACGFTYDQASSSQNSFPIISHPERCAFFGCVLFVSAFLIEAAYLRNVFHKRHNRCTLITVGLLISWVGEKAGILLLSSMIYGISPFASMELLQQIAHGGAQTAPWFTIPYIAWSFAGCFLLGYLFGRKKDILLV